MGFTYNPFTYKDYQESADVRKANNQKILSEIAVRDYGDFAWADQGKYDKLLSDYENRPGFTYDINGDALYQQYKDKYTQQGKMAMADTMGQASAMTGGYGNSYAATVGNQAYQAQLQNLNDVIPELYQLAYDRYQNEGQDMLNMIGLMGNERDFAYGQWGDGYNRLASERDYYGTQYNNERAFDYGKYEGDRNLAHGEHTNSQGYAYNNYRDEIADKQWADEFAASQSRWEADFTEAQRQFNEQMAYTKERDAVSDKRYEESAKVEKDDSPKAITPTKTDLTSSFIGNHMTKDEFMRRGKNYKQYLNEYIEPAIRKAQDGLSDEELMYLRQYYGL